MLISFRTSQVLESIRYKPSVVTYSTMALWLRHDTAIVVDCAPLTLRWIGFSFTRNERRRSTALRQISLPVGALTGTEPTYLTLKLSISVPKSTPSRAVSIDCELPMMAVEAVHTHAKLLKIQARLRQRPHYWKANFLLQNHRSCV